MPVVVYLDLDNCSNALSRWTANKSRDAAEPYNTEPSAKTATVEDAAE